MNTKLVILGALAGTLGSAFAAAISVNLTDNTGREIIASTTSAGIGGELNWNNTTGTDATLGSLLDDSGAVTLASVTWGSGGGSWRDGEANADADSGVGNAQLMRGYIDDGNGGSGVDINVTGIPYANYKVILYLSTDTNGDVYRPFEFNGISASTTGNKARYGTQPNWDDTNSITVSGLTGDLFIDGLPRGGDDRGSVAGFQIIQVPEPSSVGFLGLAGIALFLRRRR